MHTFHRFNSFLSLLADHPNVHETSITAIKLIKKIRRFYSAPVDVKLLLTTRDKFTDDVSRLADLLTFDSNITCMGKHYNRVLAFTKHIDELDKQAWIFSHIIITLSEYPKGKNVILPKPNLEWLFSDHPFLIMKSYCTPRAYCSTVIIHVLGENDEPAPVIVEKWKFTETDV